MREGMNSAPADDKLATSAKLAAPSAPPGGTTKKGTLISRPLSDRWSLTIRCVRLMIAGLVAAAIAVPGCASASTSVFDDFNGPAGSAPNPASWSYVTGHGWTGASKTIAPPTRSSMGKAISLSAPSNPAAASNQVAFRPKTN